MADAGVDAEQAGLLSDGGAWALILAALTFVAPEVWRMIMAYFEERRRIGLLIAALYAEIGYNRKDLRSF